MRFPPDSAIISCWSTAGRAVRATTDAGLRSRASAVTTAYPTATHSNRPSDKPLPHLAPSHSPFVISITGGCAAAQIISREI
jgi:hypothetical protein